MAQFNSLNDPEQDYRRQLLAAARKGQAPASAELADEYHVKLYSPAELAGLCYEAMPNKKGRLSKRCLDIGTEWIEIGDLGTSDSDLL